MTYEREDAERLLVCMFLDLWDSRRDSYDPRREDLNDEVVYDGDPIAELRQTTKNKAQTGTWMAEKVDIERAWGYASLTPRERLVLELYYGQGLSFQVVGERIERTKKTAFEIRDSALVLLLAELNTAKNRRDLQAFASHALDRRG